jgi:Rieske Fe-S protein
MASCTRRAFNLGLCAGSAGLWACASSLTTLTPMGTRLTLTYAQFPALRSAGGSAVVAVKDGFPVAVVRTGEATAVALSATCTHAACILDWDAGGNRLHCNCHDANFDLGGTVLSGPTQTPLPVYAAETTDEAIVVELS